MRVHLLRSPIIVLLAATACSAEGSAGSTPASTAVSTPPPGISAPPSLPASQVPGEAPELPADLPVDVPEGGTLEGVYPPVAGSLQDYWIVRILYAPETADALVDFYDAWFVDEGMEVQVTRNDRVARWTDRTDHPLNWVTVNFADRFYGGNNRLEVTYSADE
jgi:hypothetical protein